MVVSDMKVRMRVSQGFVVVLLPLRCHGLDGHLSLPPEGDRDTLGLPAGSAGQSTEGCRREVSF
jgi:hypothetical protein